MNQTELIKLVMSSFEAERGANPTQGLELIHDDFAVTEMNIGRNGKLFRRATGDEIRSNIKAAFQITDRQYQFIHASADEATQTVMVEFVESYGDVNTGQRYRTPQVAVCEIKDGKIWRTRHYCDDRISYEYLDQDQIDGALS